MPTKSRIMLAFKPLWRATEVPFFGTREIDWISSLISDRVAQPQCLDELHFSDHQVVFSCRMTVRDSGRGAFKKAASWPKRPGVPLLSGVKSFSRFGRNFLRPVLRASLFNKGGTRSCFSLIVFLGMPPSKFWTGSGPCPEAKVC